MKLPKNIRKIKKLSNRYIGYYRIFDTNPYQSLRRVSIAKSKRSKLKSIFNFKQLEDTLNNKNHVKKSI